MNNEFLGRFPDISYDIEYGNQYTFFSASKTIKEYSSLNKENFSFQFHSKIEGASGKIIDTCNQNGNYSILRNVTFHPDDDCYLFDLVSRFVIHTNIPTAYIANNEVNHTNSNIYYQHASSQCTVEIPLDNEWKLVFREESASQEKFFNNVFYLRDEANKNGVYRWVVHHRKIVNIDAAELIIRGCNPRFEGVLPFNNIIPRFIKKSLFRIRETRYPNFPFMAVGIVHINLPSLYLNTEIKLAHA
nr:hypothetical protein [Providencia rettgeri]